MYLLPCAIAQWLRLAACGHPRPWTGVGTRFAFGTGRFLVGPAGLEDRQPSRSSSPSLGAWPYLWGFFSPHLPVHEGAQCGLCCSVSWISEIWPAGLGLSIAHPMRVMCLVTSDLCPKIGVHFGLVSEVLAACRWLLGVQFVLVSEVLATCRCDQTAYVCT